VHQVELLLESQSKLEVVEGLLPHRVLLVVQSKVLVQILSQDHPFQVAGPVGASVRFSVPLGELQVRKSGVKLPCVEVLDGMLEGEVTHDFGDPPQDRVVRRLGVDPELLLESQFERLDDFHDLA